MANEHRHDKPKLPKFEPLPPTNLINRLINFIVAPIFYLLFTTIASIVIVPIYVIIDNFKHGRGKRGGQRVPSESDSSDYPGQSDRPNKASEFLRSYGQSYGQASSRKGE
ncbi:hypothetical protein LTR99_004508 [Exophiala xenobiotica]|uniref:Uncharacterized protein n=1 Tax=Vermiconidia calcicola TaxID=1690605 RepID=A0AAV9QFT1_9PEZI|nr:hypothetical protein H2202_003238 [Exophiala xenobiotica]KAK5539788.1 hypothetical protein LTR25_003493 [Vermiconidia calcicola]KAK5541700.1 hypothetical protein LTR23_005551 [Chaetothyriales sp. CCFEE 6169]KAK5199712.1 hypothetical protein LTR92_000253 [Exophiala xenobiotica]KAK5210881.1 hypothetical protein LTR41_003493 [Exophiala xenobiotica]